MGVLHILLVVVGALCLGAGLGIQATATHMGRERNGFHLWVAGVVLVLIGGAFAN